MASTRRTSFLAGTVAAALLALPAVADADVYCVDTGPAGCDVVEPAGDLQQGLTDAAVHAGPDTVKVGAATYPTTAPAGFLYNSSGPVSIEGAGQGMTTIAVQAAGAPPPSFTQYLGLNVVG